MSSGQVDARRIDRAKAVAAEYDALMGLSSVGLGAGLLMAALTRDTIWISFGVLVGIFSTGWYHQRYGFARPQPGRVAWTAGVTALGLAILFPVVIVDRWWTPPVSLTLLTLAPLLAAGQFLALRRVGLTAVHVLVYVALFVAAGGPVVGLGTSGPFSPYVLTACGVAFIVVGIIDHVRLVRVLGPVHEPAR